MFTTKNFENYNQILEYMRTTANGTLYQGAGNDNTKPYYRVLSINKVEFWPTGVNYVNCVNTGNLEYLISEQPIP